jgi:hypothetical protein
MSVWVDTIDLESQDGRRIRISGPGQGQQGYFLSPQSTGLLDDAPVKTIWHKTMFGQSFSGLEWERREPVFTINIGYDTRSPIDPDRDPDEWHALYADLISMFEYDSDIKIIYGAPDEDRILYARMIDKPKPFSTHSFEGKDPKLWSFGSVVFQMGCEFPFYVGKSERFEWAFEGTGTQWTRIPLYNPSDVPIWNTYEATEGARYHIPDFSWGNEYYGRGQLDLDKMVPTPLLQTGETCDIHTRPDEETYQSANDAPIGLRANGKDFEYPIPPGAGIGVNADDPEDGALFMATDVVDGGVLTMESPRWYRSPFSRPRLVRPRVAA